MSSDLFRLPFAVSPATFGVTGALVLAITAASSLMVRGQIGPAGQWLQPSDRRIGL